MKRKLTPEDLKNSDEFELLTEVTHSNLKEFVIEQIAEEKFIIRIYSVYQVVMMLIFTYLFTRGIVLGIKGFYETLTGIGIAVLFSFSALIVIHELLHAGAYLFRGAGRISFCFIPKKFIFYALADQQVIESKDFHFVALAPFVTVKLVCLAGLILFFQHPILMYFFVGVMCLHSLFCAGDVAMLAFYKLNSDKEIFNYDSKTEGKTYFYTRKQK